MTAIFKQLTCTVLLVATALVCSSCYASTQFDKNIVVVEYDAKSESALGAFPSRAAIARYVEKIKTGRPKAIVLKFFFDSPGVETENAALQKSFAGARIILQANLNKEPPTSKQLDNRFYFKGNVDGVKLTSKGVEGWLPIKQLADSAARVCFFAERPAEMIPLLVEFQGKPVPTMYACVLEELSDSGKMELRPNKAVFGAGALPINAFAEAEVTLKNLVGGSTIPVVELVKTNFDPSVFAGKVVVLTYTGSKSPMAAVGNSSYKVHNVFVAQLRGLFEQLRSVNR